MSADDWQAHRNCFRLSDEQWAKVKAFRDAAKDGGKQRYDGCAGGAYEFTFVPTSIGDIVKVRDSVENRVLDLTEDFG